MMIGCSTKYVFHSLPVFIGAHIIFTKFMNTVIGSKSNGSQGCDISYLETDTRQVGVSGDLNYKICIKSQANKEF